MPTLRLVVAVALVGVLGAACQGAAPSHSGEPVSVGTPTSTAPVRPSPTATPGSWTAAGIEALLAQARSVRRRPHVPGYDRDCGPGDGCVFGTEWSDDTTAPDGHNGCDTRNDVLREQLQDVVLDPNTHGCKVVGGHLVDPYTGRVMDAATERSQIQVDHLFPLAAAWDLGAATWTPAQRAAFANDTSIELLAVSGPANESKGDSTPASWLPPLKRYRCEYVTRYLRVAVHYRLAVTDADRRVIGFVERRSCPG